MLGKLLKHEMKAQAKSLLSFWIITLGIAVLVRIFSVVQQKVPLFQYLTVISIFTFIITIILSIAYCFFLAIKNFYKKVLRDEGYLTNTLPVKKSSIVLSHLITALVFMITTLVIIIIGCMIAFYTPESFEAMWQSFVTSMETEFQMQVGIVIAIILGMMALAYLNAVSAFYAAMSIGHSFPQNKIPASIGIGVVFYMAFQILNILSIGLIILFNHGDLEAMLKTNQLVISFIIQILSMSCINNVIMLITTYLFTNHFLKNKLNLE